MGEWSFFQSRFEGFASVLVSLPKWRLFHQCVPLKYKNIHESLSETKLMQKAWENMTYWHKKLEFDFEQFCTSCDLSAKAAFISSSEAAFPRPS